MSLPTTARSNFLEQVEYGGCESWAQLLRQRKVSIEGRMPPQPDRTYTIHCPGRWIYTGTINRSEFVKGCVKWTDGSQFQGTFSYGFRLEKGEYRQRKHTEEGHDLWIVYAPDCQYTNGYLRWGTRTIYKQGSDRKISIYRGSFQNGLSEGTGMLKTFEILSQAKQVVQPYSAIYCGQFKSNQFEGKGKLTVFNKPDNQKITIMEGNFQEGHFSEGMVNVLQYMPGEAGFPAQHKQVYSQMVRDPIVRIRPRRIQPQPEPQPQPARHPPSVSIPYRPSGPLTVTVRPTTANASLTQIEENVQLQSQQPSQGPYIDDF